MIVGTALLLTASDTKIPKYQLSEHNVIDTPYMKTNCLKEKQKK